MLDKSEVTTLGLPPTTSHGGSDTNISVDGAAGTSAAAVVAAASGGGVAAAGGGGGESCSGIAEPQRTRAALEHLQQKILKITEQIRVEQEARDDNVAEYLKLAHNADKQQASRIKQVFEKKNQKSAQTIAHLHKKLEHYHRKLKEIEQNGPARQPKDVLRDMQQGLKDVGANVRAGFSGFGGGVVEGVKGGVSAFTHTAVVSKPREFASLFRHKFGSADNIAHLKDTLEDGVGGASDDALTPRALSGSATLVSSPKYGSDDDCSSASSGSGPQAGRTPPPPPSSRAQLLGRAAGGPAGDQGQPGAHGGCHRGHEEPAAERLLLHDPLLAGGGVQIREAGGAAERSNRAAPERDDQPETGTGQYGGEGGLSVLRTGQRHTGGRGVVSDPHHQAGAAAAAAAGGAAGRGGERQCPRPAGQAHQRHPGPHGRAAGVRVHGGQLHHPADEDAGAGGCHRVAHPAALHPVEAPGLLGTVVVAQLNTHTTHTEHTRTHTHTNTHTHRDKTAI